MANGNVDATSTGTCHSGTVFPVYFFSDYPINGTRPLCLALDFEKRVPTLVNVVFLHRIFVDRLGLVLFLSTKINNLSALLDVKVKFINLEIKFTFGFDGG